MSRVPRLAVILVVLAASFTTTGQAQASAAGFVDAKASWENDVLTVTFKEVGLDPGVTTTISLAAKGSVDAVCKKDGRVAMSVHASGTVKEVSDYTASDDGSVDGVRTYSLAVDLPEIGGGDLDCTMRVVRRYSVTLHDLNTGAVRKIHGQDPPDGTPT
jgi:hypothetical protein